MHVKTFAGAVHGVDARAITVEVNAGGQPVTQGNFYHLVGLPDNAVREGLKVFCRKIKGFETGMIMGLESKTSAPVQVVRDDLRRCAGFANLFMVGEGSGHAGGIISSGTDGIRAARQIIGLAG